MKVGGAEPAAVSRFERVVAHRINEDILERRHELVAGRAIYGPVTRQCLTRRENLLHDDGKSVAIRIRRATTVDCRAQSLQVPARLEQPVDVIDPKPVDDAISDELQHRSMRRVEHRLALDAQADEIGDVEESPVVEVALRRAPEREHVVLTLQQGEQSCAAVLGAAPSGHELPCRRIAHRQLQLGRQRGRIDGEVVREVVNARAPIADGNRELVTGDDVLERVAEHRHEHLAGEASGRRGPVDVEPVGVAGRIATLEQVVPIGIVRSDAHVVGHDVEHDAKAMCMGFVSQCDESLVASQRRAHLRGIDDVVPVRAPFACGEHRGAVHVRNAELLQVWNARAGIGEREARAELKAVRCSKRNDGHSDYS